MARIPHLMQSPDPASSPLASLRNPVAGSSWRTPVGLSAALAFASATGSLAGQAASAPAADGVDDALELPEMTVQAQRNQAVSSPKFTAPLSDLPQSVSVLPQDLFTQQGARNLTDILRNTPGITFNAGENGFASGLSNFSLRGIDTTGSVFIDGARDSGNYFRDAFNIEQVEVAKGPSGDNGRGGAGGYVNLVTKSPQAGNFERGAVDVAFDESAADQNVRATLDLNRRINAHTAVRLNALWQEGGVAGREHAEKNVWGIAPSLALGLQGPTRAVVSYQHLEQRDIPDWGVPGALFEGLNSHQPSAGGKANGHRFYGHETDYDDVTSDAVYGRVEHDISPTMRLSSQVRWSQTEREAMYTLPTAFDAASGLVTTQRQAYQRENTSLSSLTNLAASFETGPVQHALSTGIEISRENAEALRFPTNGALGNPGSVPVATPDPSRPLAGFVGLVPSQTSEVDIDTVAAYLYDTLQLSPRWQMTGGLRVEHYKVQIASRTAAGAPQGPDGYERSDTTVSGKLGIVFKPAGNGSIYAAVGVAALPPGSFLSNPDISREGDNAFPGWRAGQNSATAKVQRSLNYELGAKWDLFSRRLSTSAALFRTERQNIAMAGTVNGVPNTFAGYAEQILQGIELSASGRITPAWTLYGGLLLLDTERRHGPEVDAARLAANPADYGSRLTTNGDELAFSPRVSFTLWTTYRLPFGLTLGGGLEHVGDSWAGRPDDAERIIANGVAGKLPAHTVANLMAAYEINRHLTLRLNINNVTDEFYTVSTNWSTARATPGTPRSFLLAVDWSF